MMDIGALPSTEKQSLVEKVHEELPGLLEDFCDQHNWSQLGLNYTKSNIQDMALQQAGFLLEEAGFSIKVMNTEMRIKPRYDFMESEKVDMTTLLIEGREMGWGGISGKVELAQDRIKRNDSGRALAGIDAQSSQIIKPDHFVEPMGKMLRVHLQSLFSQFEASLLDQSTQVATSHKSGPRL